MRECQAVFALQKKKQCKICFSFLNFKAKFVCCKIDPKYTLAAEEVEIISFFLRWRKLTVERNKKQNFKLFLLFNVVY